MIVKKYPLNNRPLKYVVIGARYQEKWLFVRHKLRDTWEVPGGHIEKGETPDQAAARELHEETGAVDFKMKAVCDYSVTREVETFGRLYLAEIKELGKLPDMEIVEVRPYHESMQWTYSAIQPLLLDYIKAFV